MLTFFAPLLAYLASFPMIIVSLVRVEFGILFFIAVVPIIAAMKKIATFPGGHNMADYLLISMVLGSIAKRLREGRPIPEPSTSNYVILLMVIWSGFSLLRGYEFFDPYLNTLRLMTWKNFLILPAIYFVAINSIEKETIVNWIIVAVCISMLAMDFNFHSTFKWLKSYHYSDDLRIAGTFTMLGPNEMSVFYAMYTFLLLGISYFVSDKKLRLFIRFVCLCNCYPIIYSYSRAGYVCMLVGACALGILKDRRVLLGLLLLILAYQWLLPNSVVERIDMTFADQEQIESGEAEVGEQDTHMMEVGGVTVDTVGRAELWKRARGYLSEYPLTGIGFDTFVHREGMITHSLYWRILAEQGLVGMLIFLLFIVTILRTSYRLYRHSNVELGRGIGLGFLLCIVVQLAGNITGDQFIYYNLMAIYWLFLGIVSRFANEFLEDGDAKPVSHLHTS